MATVHRHSSTRLTASAQNDEQFGLSIVFAHGLRGHPRGTWEAAGPASARASTGASNGSTNATKKSKGLKSLFKRRIATSPTTETARAVGPSSGPTSSSPAPAPSTVFWLEEYLAQDIPQAVVWTYGYAADIIGGFFQASISQHGRDLSVRLDRETDIGVRAPLRRIGPAPGP